MTTYSCRRCGYKFSQLGHLKAHLQKKKPCKPLYDDVGHMVLLSELETDEGKKGNKSEALHKFLRLDAIVDKDEYIMRMREDYDEMRKTLEKSQDEMRTMNEKYEALLSKHTTSKVYQDGIEKNRCPKCDVYLDGSNEMEMHIRKDCVMSLEFNNIYKYNTSTFGRSLYNNAEQIDTAGDIYIVETDFSLEEPHYKIGKTVDVRNRMVQYRTGCVREPRLHCYYPFSDVLKADDYLKEALYKFHLKREIYRGDLNDIKEVIRGCQLWMDGCIAEFVPKLSI